MNTLSASRGLRDGRGIPPAVHRLGDSSVERIFAQASKQFESVAIESPFTSLEIEEISLQIECHGDSNDDQDVNRRKLH